MNQTQLCTFNVMSRALMNVTILFMFTCVHVVIVVIVGFPSGHNSTAAQGNYLEAINLSFNGECVISSLFCVMLSVHIEPHIILSPYDLNTVL